MDNNSLLVIYLVILNVRINNDGFIYIIIEFIYIILIEFYYHYKLLYHFSDYIAGLISMG